jgi:hypothetical protein
MNQGFIGLYRKFTKWEWYDHSPTKALFLHLILMANHQEGQWHGIPVGRGQHISGRKKLAKALGLSERQIRTAQNNLKSTKEIVTQATSQYTLYTVTEYETYNPRQGLRDPQATKQSTNQRPTNDQPTTTNKNEENEKNEKKEEYMSVFNNFWNTYPSRNGKKLEKGKTQEAFFKIPVKHYSDIIQAVKNYSKDYGISQGIGIRDPKRFLKDNYYREYLSTKATPENSTQEKNGKGCMEWNKEVKGYAWLEIINGKEEWRTATDEEWNKHRDRKFNPCGVNSEND